MALPTRRRPLHHAFLFAAWLLAAPAGASLAMVEDASACVHGLSYDEALDPDSDEPVHGMYVESAFDNLDWPAVVKLAIKAHPSLADRPDADQAISSSELDDKGYVAQMMAMAIVRTEGKTDVSLSSIKRKKARTPSRSVARKNIAWATEVLTTLHERGDLYSGMYLVEALVLDETQHDRARALADTILEESPSIEESFVAPLATLYKGSEHARQRAKLASICAEDLWPEACEALGHEVSDEDRTVQITKEELEEYASEKKKNPRSWRDEGRLKWEAGIR